MKGDFERALGTNGDSGHTYKFRRRDALRLDDETYTNTLVTLETGLGRSALMSTLERGPDGPAGVVKFQPELSPQEIQVLHDKAGIIAEAA